MEGVSPVFFLEVDKVALSLGPLFPREDVLPDGDTALAVCVAVLAALPFFLGGMMNDVPGPGLRGVPRREKVEM